MREQHIMSTKFPGAPIEELQRPKVSENNYQAFNPRKEILSAGWNGFDSRALPCDILVEHDFAITVRDGSKLYCDIYRSPQTDIDEKVPAIVCWSPFGKKFNGLLSLKLMVPWSLGIPNGTLSGLEKFEAPDPADWVPKGYAIVNVDSRGAGDSDGVMAIMGTQEAEDGYDVIEALARMPWCSGRVGLAGNSHLAIVQWFIAALKPPSLAAIAPWEGCGDLYREQFARGGIYGGDLFDKLIVKYMLRGHHGLESFREMFKQHPLANDWWNDKRPDMTRINVPTYITGTWTNTMHGMGAIRGWLEVATTEKWLRWHPYQEWYDLWGSPQAVEELKKFFAYYLKGEKNGWEQTPRVRMAVLRFGEKEPIENIVVPDFPLPTTDYRQLFLSDNNTLTPKTPGVESIRVYESETTGECASFTYTFPSRTQLIGMSKAVLYMSCDDNDDMDVYVLLRKLDKEGKAMQNFNLPWRAVPVNSISEIAPEQQTEVVLYNGPLGILRASHRKIDPAKSMHECWPYHPHDVEENVQPGTVVRLDIGIWAMGIEYEAGESIRVEISGRSPGISNFGSFEHVRNKGRHKVHFGGQYSSHVLLPFT